MPARFGLLASRWRASRGTPSAAWGLAQVSLLCALTMRTVAASAVPPAQSARPAGWSGWWCARHRRCWEGADGGDTASGRGYRRSGDFGDDAQRAFAADHQARQVVAGAALFGARAGADDLAAGGDHFQRQHVLAHGAVAHGVGAAGAGGVMPPMLASAPGSMGKNRPVSLMASLSCLRVMPGCTVTVRSSALMLSTRFMRLTSMLMPVSTARRSGACSASMSAWGTSRSWICGQQVGGGGAFIGVPGQWAVALIRWLPPGAPLALRRRQRAPAHWRGRGAVRLPTTGDRGDADWRRFETPRARACCIVLVQRLEALANRQEGRCLLELSMRCGRHQRSKAATARCWWRSCRAKGGLGVTAGCCWLAR